MNFSWSCVFSDLGKGGTECYNRHGIEKKSSIKYGKIRDISQDNIV